MKPTEKSFWLTNISKRNVSIYDLNLTIRAFSSINLLDKKHYSFSLEELNKSVESGSIYKKQDKLVIRKVAPEVVKDGVILLAQTCIPSRERSVLEINNETYEELNVFDEQYSEDDLLEEPTSNNKS